MAYLDKELDEMFEEIKNPKQEVKYIYERANGKVYRREFGAHPSTREQINTEEVENDKI